MPIASAARRSNRGANRRRAASGALAWLGIPAVIWYVVFTIGPLVAMFYISLLDWSNITAESTFSGLGNFGDLATDPVFKRACLNTAIHLVAALSLMLPSAFALGYFVARRPFGHRVLRVILFTPALISLAAKAMIFFSIFSPRGLLNGTLRFVGLDELATPWLANTNTALATVIAVDLWAGIGFTAVLFSARIAGVGEEVFEAAELDGASQWARVWRIAFPICREYFGVILMLQFIWLFFTSAGSVLLLTRGGPGTSSTTLSFLLYSRAFLEGEIGYSQAVGVVLFVVGIAGIAAIRRLFRAPY
jgi:multiple sugar transport system permease protein